MHGRDEKCIENFCWNTERRRSNGRSRVVTLKMDITKYVVSMCVGFVWLRAGAAATNITANFGCVYVHRVLQILILGCS